MEEKKPDLEIYIERKYLERLELIEHKQNLLLDLMEDLNETVTNFLLLTLEIKNNNETVN